MKTFFCARCNKPVSTDCDDNGTCECGESRVRLLPAGVLTVKLYNGCTVLAKLYKGSPTAKTYANLTQARAAQVKLGAGWDVCCWGRPFYVAMVDAEGRPL